MSWPASAGRAAAIVHGDRIEATGAAHGFTALARKHAAVALLCALVASGLGSRPATATEPLEGAFLAERACPAFQSFRRGTNPGNVSVAEGERYPLKGANARPASHYLVRIPGASPPDRWVAADCGQALAEAAARTGETGGGAGASRAASAGPSDDGAADWQIPAGDYVLAVSWHPAFCETEPRRAECGTRSARGPDGEALVLHGLWFRDRDRIDCPARRTAPISRATRRALEPVMPGTRSNLEDHQWRKHGACFGVSADDYFAAAIHLLKAVAEAAPGDLMRRRIGDEVSKREVDAAFDEAYGRGAGARVTLTCTRDGRRNLLREMRVALSGTITPDADLGDLMRGAAPMRGGCGGGLVDPAGPQ